MIQAHLIPPEPFDALPTDSGRYVVSLQDKPGERDALANASLDVWRDMMPLIRFLGRKRPEKPMNSATVGNWVKRVSDAVGTHPVYLDIGRPDPCFDVSTAHGCVPLLQAVYEAARKRGLRFVPVAWAGDGSPAHNSVVHDSASADGNGLALRVRPLARLTPPGETWRTWLAAQVDELSVNPERCDLLVDVEYLDPDIEIDVTGVASMLDEMLEVGPWRGFAVLATSMPSALSCIEEDSVGLIPRREWELWTGLTASGLRRVPCYGDYAVQHPRPPDESGPGMRANIRYTSSSQTVVARGRAVLQEGNAQYADLCKQLVARPEFRGGGFSWGDSVIEGCADGQVDPGAQRMWRGAGTSHHLQVVTEQLRLRQARG